MKQFKKISLIACLALILYLLVFSFSKMSIAEQTSTKDCINSCEDKKQVCFNINPDKRLCEQEFQNCVASCKAEGESSSSSQQRAKSTAAVKY
jgi:hypothetical protein